MTVTSAMHGLDHGPILAVEWLGDDGKTYRSKFPSVCVDRLLPVTSALFGPLIEPVLSEDSTSPDETPARALG